MEGLGEVKLREVMQALHSEGEVDAALEQALLYLRQVSNEKAKRAHSYLCAAVLRELGVEGREKGCQQLLHCLGPAQAFSAAYNNSSRAS